MKKHNPLSKLSPLARSIKFLFHWRSIVNTRSDTAVCDDCGKLLDAPDYHRILVWCPAAHGLVMGILFYIEPSGYIQWYHTVISWALAFVIIWVLPSQLLAFGKWKEAELGSMNEVSIGYIELN